MNERLLLFAWEKNDYAMDLIDSGFDLPSLIREGSILIEDGSKDHFKIVNAETFKVIYDV